MTEKERIEKVMQHEGMNSALFANAIGIQGSTLSHILNGRNNPSLSVLQSILNRFPDISPEWLIMGQGTMERATKQSQVPTLFDVVDETSSKTVTHVQEMPQISAPVLESIRQNSPVQPLQSVSLPFIEAPKVVVTETVPAQPPRSVVKVIVYYSDNTFQEFK